MIRTLSRLFNIREEEWSRLSILSLTMFLFIIGNTWAQIVIPAAFLVQIGVDKLPYMFIGDAIVTVFTLAIYSAFVDRISNERLMIGITVLGVIGVAIGLAILEASYKEVAYPFFYLLFRALSELISTHIGVYVNGFYDTRAAKRVWPFLGSVLRIAVLLGGVTVPLINSRIAPEGIISLWGLTMLLMVLLTLSMPYITKGTPVQQTPVNTNQQKTSYIQNMREGYKYVLDSNYLRWIAGLAFLMMIVFTMMNLQAYKILDSTLGTTEKITDFTGTIIVAGSLLILPVQFFLFSRLVARIGVGNTNLIYPITTLVVSFLMLLYEAQWAAGLAYFNLAILNVTFRAPTDEMLFNAVPLRIKGRARAFIGGMIIPLGTLVAGILTLPILPDRVVEYTGLILGGGAIAYVLTAIIARNKYSQALITLLQQENFSFLFSNSSADIVLDATTLKYLEDRINDSESEDFTLFMANILLDLAGNDAVPILDRVARAGSEDLKVGILDILIAANVRSGNVRTLYMDFLQDPDPVVRRTTLRGLEQLVGVDSPQYLEIAIQLLDAQDNIVQAQVLPALLRSDNESYRAVANQVLHQMLENDDSYTRARGVNILGETGSLEIVQYLGDSSEKVRLAAAMALEELLTASKDRETATQLILTHSPELVNDSVERVRIAAIRTLGQVGTPTAFKKLVPVLTDNSPRVRDETVNIFTKADKMAMMILQDAKQQKDNDRLNKMATAVLARIDREAHVADVFQYIRRNLREIYRYFAQVAAVSVLSDFPSIGILQRTIIEYNDELTDDIFYLLSSIHSPAAVSIITESLDSDNSRARANAIEALETLVTPQLARLIAPLFDPEAHQETLLKIGQEELDVEVMDLEEVIRELLRDENPWFRVIMAFALGEMGAELAKLNQPPAERIADKPEPKEEPKEEFKEEPKEEHKEEGRRRTRRLSADMLFGMLGDDDSKTEEKAPEPEARPLDDDELQRVTTQIINPVPQHVTLIPFSLEEIQVMLRFTGQASTPEVKTAVQAARRMIASRTVMEEAIKEEVVLSAVEKIIFLKGVPFFADMTVNQLKALATVTEEQLFNAEAIIFDQGEAGGTLYVVVSGKVAIERKNAAGTSARLSTIEARGYFGEATFFDNSNTLTTALALQDTLTLRLRHEPMVALMQEYPDLSLQLIKVLSKRIQETDQQVADLSRRRSRTMHNLYDKLD